MTAALPSAEAPAKRVHGTKKAKPLHVVTQRRLGGTMYESSTMTVDLEQAIARNISHRTWGRIKGLHVHCEQDRVNIHGISPSYYLKQLALQAVREVVPSASVDLAIAVNA
jgi:hypothetical protein